MDGLRLELDLDQETTVICFSSSRVPFVCVIYYTEETKKMGSMTRSQYSKKALFLFRVD
jgi:hypothetical protein